MQGDRPDDSTDVERQQGMRERLSRLGEEAKIRPLETGEAGGRPGRVGERQAASVSEGNRALVTEKRRAVGGVEGCAEKR